MKLKRWPPANGSPWVGGGRRVPGWLRQGTGVRLGAAILLLLLFMELGLQAAAATNREPVSVWDWTFRGWVGAGYRDNVLRTSIAPESSSLLAVSGELGATRLSERGSWLTLDGVAEHTQYFDSPSMSHEQIFSASALGSQPVGKQEQLQGSLQYLYQYAVVDVSDTEADLRRVLIEGHGVYAKPGWKHDFSPGFWARVEGIASRQFFVGVLDDYWEGGGKLTVAHLYRNRSELGLSYQSRHRFYDTREQFTELGEVEDGTRLVYWQQEVVAEWRHYWDAAGRWRTMAKAGWLGNQDNGSGYFDYNRVQLAAQLRWQRGNWEVLPRARVGWYTYDKQRVGNDRRERTFYTLELRIERRLGEHWLLYAAGEREWNLSNDPLDEYRDWMAAGGVGVEF